MSESIEQLNSEIVGAKCASGHVSTVKEPAVVVNTEKGTLQDDENTNQANGAATTYAVSVSGSSVFDTSRKCYAYRFFKRLFDVVFSFLVCIILCVPVGVLCIAIMIDSPGSPIFTQKRVGRFGKPIKVLKLRTMYSDAHSHPEKYFNEEQMKRWLREYKVDDDPRVTKIGVFLRKTSLDELPQFLNVLKGDMSVIGCRPITEEELGNFKGIDKEYFLSQKMGITGWWQVTDRNNAAWEDGSRQEVELYYVQHASLRLDVGIFFETFKAIAKKTGK